MIEHQIKLKRYKQALEQWEEEYPPFDFALTRTGSAFDDYFRASGWSLIKKTDTASFYKRNDEDKLAVIGGWGIHQARANR